jgi:hypothetical protein
MRVVIVTCGILVGALWFAAFTPAWALVPFHGGMSVAASLLSPWLVGSTALSAGTLEEGLVLNLAIASFAKPFILDSPGDVPALVALLLTVLDAIGRLARLDSLRGGLSLCAWKQAKST